MEELQVTCGEAYDFAKSLPPNTKPKEIAQQLISTKLSIKGSQYRSEEDDDYNRLVKTVSTRISSLIQKVRQHAFERQKVLRTDVLIDLHVDCPALVPTDSQPQSQDSVSSSGTEMSLSQNRVLEFQKIKLTYSAMISPSWFVTISYRC